VRISRESRRTVIVTLSSACPSADRTVPEIHPVVLEKSSREALFGMSPGPDGGKLLCWARQVHALKDVSRHVTLRRLRIGLNLAVLVLASVLKRQSMCEAHVLLLSVLPENAGQKLGRDTR